MLFTKASSTLQRWCSGLAHLTKIHHFPELSSTPWLQRQTKVTLVCLLPNLWNPVRGNYFQGLINAAKQADGGKTPHLSKHFNLGEIRYFNKKNPYYWQTRGSLKKTLEIISSASARFETHWNCSFIFTVIPFSALDTLSTTPSHQFELLAPTVANFHNCFTKCPVTSDFLAWWMPPAFSTHWTASAGQQSSAPATTPRNAVIVSGTYTSKTTRHLEPGILAVWGNWRKWRHRK